ncbi:MAG: 4Fe-4S binding protein [Fimbriimonas sp.]|nr:4Fe-4S binding protein [Fimbriimonas sp.]
MAPLVAFGQTADQHSQPPPQFTDYRIPIERAAAPRDGSFQYVDLALLACLLVLTAWIVLKRRSRKELRIVSLFALGYFGFYRLGCVCSIGSIQNVAYAIAHSDYRLPLTVAGFFVLPLLAALFFGRVFCGGVCPMGAMQDLLLVKPIRIPASWRAPLEAAPYVYLGAAILFASTGSAFAICEYDPFVGFFRMHGHFLMILFGSAILAVSLFIGRPYCRFLCPYGVLLRWASVFAKYSVSVTPQECVQCHMCADACPFEAIQPPAIAKQDRTEIRRRLTRTLAVTPILIALFAFAGWRMSPMMASWDLRVHRAHVLRDAEMHPPKVKTVLADAWDRHRKTTQDAYVEGSAVEHEFAIGAPILGAWIGLVFALKSLSNLRRRGSNDYEADSSSCLSCARCYSACPVPHREYALPPLPMASIEPPEPVGGAV